MHSGWWDGFTSLLESSSICSYTLCSTSSGPVYPRTPWTAVTNCARVSRRFEPTLERSARHTKRGGEGVRRREKVGRCGEIWGDVGRCGEITLERSACQHSTGRASSSSIRVRIVSRTPSISVSAHSCAKYGEPATGMATGGGREEDMALHSAV